MAGTPSKVLKPFPTVTGERTSAILHLFLHTGESTDRPSPAALSIGRIRVQRFTVNIFLATTNRGESLRYHSKIGLSRRSAKLEPPLNESYPLVKTRRVKSMLLVMKEFCIGSIFPRPSSSRKYFHVALIVAMTLFRCANGDGEVTPTLLAPTGCRGSYIG